MIGCIAQAMKGEGKLQGLLTRVQRVKESPLAFSSKLEEKLEQRKLEEKLEQSIKALDAELEAFYKAYKEQVQ